ncbi:MAG: hypothetical protein DK841_01835 [Candidatus Melainabacteria bacterium]|nr:MAG: hypothetical protein DK841_01835 [Candidatus Melainabacteria bacterium]
MKKLLAIIGLLFAFGSIATATEYYSTIDEQLRHEYFENNVKNQIQKCWRRPATTRSQDKSISLVFTLDQNGNVVKARIAGSSGLKRYDDSAIKALYKAAPFGKFPPKYKGKTMSFQYVILVI